MAAIQRFLMWTNVSLGKMCAIFLDAASRYMVDVAKNFFCCLFEKTQKSSKKLPFFLEMSGR